MEYENEQAQEEVVEQVEQQEEEQNENQDVLTLSGEERAEYEKWKAKKEERQRFVEKAKDAPKPKQTFNVTADKLERMELKLDGYSSEEVEAIMELGGSKALANPLVKTAIEAMRNKAKSENERQPLNSKSPVFQKFTQADLNNMSAKELEKILPKD